MSKISKFMKLVTVLSFCFSFSVNSAYSAENEITVITKSPPMHYNGALTASTQTLGISTQVFASPLRYDLNWNPMPYLAKSWEFSDDQKTLTLHLEENAVFHDGKPVTAEDVIFSIDTIKKNHPFQTMFTAIDSMEAPDKHTVKINLSYPYPSLLLAMSPALCPIIPKHVYGDGQEIKTHPANIDIVGSGPYKMVEAKAGEYVILEKFDKYFIPDRPHFDKVIFRFIKDPSSRMLSMTKGEAQLFPLVENTHNVKRMSKNENLMVTDKGYDGISGMNLLEFNTLKKPFSDVAVRKAINHAIDRSFIINKLHSGLSKPATGPIIPTSPFYEPNVPKYEYDLDKANKMLDDAGYKPNAEGIRFTAVLDYEPGLPEQQKLVAEYLKSQLKKIGIEIKLNTSPDWGTWADRVSNWDHDMTLSILFNWGDPVIGTHRSYLSSNIRKGVPYANMSNYKNPRVDEILNAAAQEMDLEKRKQLYSEFQKIVMDDLPIIQLNLIPYFTVYNKSLDNVVTSIWGPLSPMDEIIKK